MAFGVHGVESEAHNRCVRRVEEKYPFEVLSIQLNEFPTIILLDGGGYTQGAENWIKGQAGKNKLLHVFNQGDLTRFVSSGRI